MQVTSVACLNAARHDESPLLHKSMMEKKEADGDLQTEHRSKRLQVPHSSHEASCQRLDATHSHH